MTIMCDEGNMVAYSLVYLEIWRPWAPVHVIRRIRDGTDISSAGVEGVEGVWSHIDGAIRSNPGMASCATVVSSIVARFKMEEQLI